MGLQHAAPGEIVDLSSWGQELPPGKAKTITKTPAIELIRIDLPAGRELPTHEAPGFIVVQCIKGEVEFTAFGRRATLRNGQLLYLEPKEPHSVLAKEDAAILLTVCRTERA